MRTAAAKRGRAAAAGIVAATGLAVVLSGCGGGSNDDSGPKNAVQKYVSGLSEHNWSKACSAVTPSQQKSCNDSISSAGISDVHIKVGRQVIHDDRAMVAISGKFCGGESQCQSYKKTGMPGGSTSFDTAFKKVTSGDNDSLGATAVVKVKGHWYVQLS